MAGPRSMPILLFALALGTNPLSAQDPSGTQGEAEEEASVTTPEADADIANDAPVQAAPKKPTVEDTSPYDYRSSEQISEDSSVSFPVDI